VRHVQDFDAGSADRKDLLGGEGRGANTDLEVGICGEHGGDPDSIGFFHDAELDDVSCSPYRLPVARPAAAQAALADGRGGRSRR
jgi:pyruvate,orthophosphate dikinase